MGQLTTCLADRITKQTVVLNGIPVRLDKIAKGAGVSACMISRVFSGSRNGSIKVIEGISKALGMTIEDTLVTIRSHRSKPSRNSFRNSRN